MEKKLTKGKYELNYLRYIDDMGFERDSFDLFDTEKRMHRPFMTAPKVSNVDRNSPINILGYEYTDEELEQILDEQIAKFSPQ